MWHSRPGCGSGATAEGGCATRVLQITLTPTVSRDTGRRSSKIVFRTPSGTFHSGAFFAAGCRGSPPCGADNSARDGHRLSRGNFELLVCQTRQSQRDLWELRRAVAKCHSRDSCRWLRRRSNRVPRRFAHHQAAHLRSVLRTLEAGCLRLARRGAEQHIHGASNHSLRLTAASGRAICGLSKSPDRCAIRWLSGESLP